MPDFIPRSDLDCLDWSRNYAARISSSPAVYGISAADAALLVSSQSVFADALRTAQEPGTRTSVAIRAKNDAREAMERIARQLAKVARAKLTTNRVELINLRLCTGKGRGAPRSKIGRPIQRPNVGVRAIRGSTVSLTLRDPASPHRLGKAHGISGAQIFTFVGDEPPTDLARWSWQRSTSRNNTTVYFGSDLPPGTKVWICARWFNPRSQHGPMSSPTYAYLGCPEMRLKAA